MPKNMGKGGKSFKAGNAKSEPNKRDMTLADPALGEDYAVIKKTLGNLRLECQLPTGEKVIGVIRGAMVRKQWITVGDVVLISKREFNERDNVDIIHKFQPPEVRVLVKEGHIPRDFRGNDEGPNGQEFADIEFVMQQTAEDQKESEAQKFDRNALVTDDPLAYLENAMDAEEEDLEDL
jgi:translation initiation factor 1A